MGWGWVYSVWADRCGGAESVTFREEIIGDARLILGDCLEILPTIGRVHHIICDPPYEASLHDSKNKLQTRLRSDGGPNLRSLDFDPINSIRTRIIDISYRITDGWFIAFCTVEGTWEWANVINASPMKYKRACIWIKPDSTPQLNGQCPAQGYECFVTAWCGAGHSKWNAGGKRGVYTHLVNNTERHGMHPTEKPRKLMSEIVVDFTMVGDLICDPFMGSGTTGVSTIQVGRRFIGIERNEEYFDVACRRIDAAYRQPRLFQEPSPEPKQEAFAI